MGFGHLFLCLAAKTLLCFGVVFFVVADSQCQTDKQYSVVNKLPSKAE